MDLQSSIKNLAQKYAPDFVKVRRYLHQNPELSFQEHKTSAYIKEQLQNIGITDFASVAETGILATIYGHGQGETILLRADMDALPIQEVNSVSYASQNKGVMHACGHDVHSASLLLCAKILFELRDRFQGKIKLLFQPGEEVMPGGASLVMKEAEYQELGILPHIGQHVQPNLPVGKVGFCSGKFMASMDELFLTVTGKGGHAAMPEHFIDPVLIAAHLIVAAQQLVSRMASPKIPSVLSFGKVCANGAINVIPEKVTIEGTFRTMDRAWRKVALEKLEHMMTSIAEGMGGKCELRINHGYPCLDNDTDLTEEMKSSAVSYLGKENVVVLDQWMAAEDFSYYAEKQPACFYLLGVGNETENITSGLHTATFNIDEAAMELGGGLMAWLALNHLEQH